MSEGKTTVAVLGGGRWARALAMNLCRNQDHVARVLHYRRERAAAAAPPSEDSGAFSAVRGEVAPDAARGEPVEPPPATTPPEAITDLAALAQAELLFLAVPAAAVRQLLREAGAAGAWNGGQLLVHAIGSLEPGAATLTRISDVVRQETALRRIGALAGPALAQDLEESRPAALVCGSRFDEVGAAAARALSSPALRVYATRDLIGVELARATVAVVALAGGIAQALNLGPAARAVLVTRGAAEMARLGVALGASERTFYGLAGLGEMVVATEGRGSADFELGVLLAKGVDLEQAQQRIGRTCDSPIMVKEAFAQAQARKVRMTLVTALHRWIGGQRSTVQALRDLFASDGLGE